MRPGELVSDHARCFAPYYTHTAWILIAGLLATIGVAGAIFVTLPRALVARRNLLPLPKQFLSAIESIELTAAKAGIPPPLTLLDPQPHPTARVISGLGRPTLIVSFGMLPLSSERPEAFSAIIAHELAHIKNRDARKAEIALSTWWGLATATLVPYAIALVTGSLFGLSANGLVLRQSFEAASIPWSDMAKICAIFLLSILIRNALLRAREFAADQYASDYLLARPALHELFDSAMPNDSHAMRWNLMSAHPPLQARLDHLSKSRLRIKVSPWETLTLGLLAHLSAAALSIPLSYLAYGGYDSFTFITFSSIPVGIILGTGLWSIMWRSAAFDSLHFGRLCFLGLTLGIGAVLSEILVPNPTDVEPILLIAISPSHALAAALQVGGWTVTVIIIGAFARSWARKAVRADRTHAYLMLTVGSIGSGALAAFSFLVISTFITLLRGFVSEPRPAISDVLIVGAFHSFTDKYVWICLVLAISAALIGQLCFLVSHQAGSRPDVT